MQESLFKDMNCTVFALFHMKNNERGAFHMAIIEAEGLSKVFRVARRRPGLLGGLRSVVDPQVRLVHAVQDLSLYVERGEMIGLLGPNGAGKSTTIKMLTGILTPSSGNMRVLGSSSASARSSGGTCP